eukprot:UN29993
MESLDPDGQRPFTAAMNNGWGEGISPVLDVQGVNYHYEEYEKYHKSHPEQPMIGSETASCTTDRGVYWGEKGYTSAYPSLRGRGCDANGKCKGITCLEDWLEPSEADAWMAGGFAWTGFDYKGEPTPDGWHTVNAHYGCCWDEAGFPKDAFYYYKSWWTDEFVIYTLPHWNWNEKRLS